MSSPFGIIRRKETPQEKKERLARKKAIAAEEFAAQFAEAAESTGDGPKTDKPPSPDTTGPPEPGSEAGSGTTVSLEDVSGLVKEPGASLPAITSSTVAQSLPETISLFEPTKPVIFDDRFTAFGSEGTSSASRVSEDLSSPIHSGSHSLSPIHSDSQISEENTNNGATEDDVVMGGTEDLHPPSPFEYTFPPKETFTRAEENSEPQKSQFTVPPMTESQTDKVDPVLAFDDPGVGNPEIPDNQDMRDDLTYQNQRQPPVGMRIGHALNFLADEDIDRCIDWERKADEVEKFLLFAEANDKGSWTFAELGKTSKAMVEDGLSRVKAHRLFNKHHYDNLGEVPPLDPKSVPKPAARLAPIPGISIELAPEKKLDKDRYPRYCHYLHRPQTPVNQIYMENENRMDKREHYIAVLAKDEDTWFQLPGDKQPADKPLSNLSYIENKTYEDCIAAESGWVFTFQEGKEAKFYLPDATPLNDSAEHFAKERGARRAGFQHALRGFKNKENRAAQTPWRKLVLPLTAKEVEAARAQATDRGLHPLGMAPSQLPALASLETFPYTFWMEQYGRVHRLYSERARQLTLAEESHKRYWTALPSRDNAPYVYRGVDANTQYEQDMYIKMKTVIKMLEREEKIAPRPLLTDVMKYLKMGFEDSTPPAGMKFRDIDWLRAGEEFRGLTEAELTWLKFLTQGSIHHGMVDKLSPRASLYLTFADRLMKLMDDVSPTALWPDLDTKVSVETLLNKMHEGLDGPVKKTKFYVYDALMWLDRLAKAGWCRFKPNRRNYGFVQRTIPDCHPEHLISWRDRRREELNPNNEDDEVGAPRRDTQVRTYPQAIKEKIPETELDTTISDWYHVLAFRLGVQHRRIEDTTARKSWVEGPQHPRAMLLESIQRWQANWSRLAAAHEVPTVMDVVARASPCDHEPNMTPEAALLKIRHGIIAECVFNRDMLVPARVKRYTNKDGVRMAVMVRPPLWDWAKSDIRGRSKQFFSVDRWPLNVQSQQTRERIETDKDLDPQQTWDPCAEDPCPAEWHRPNQRPYADEKIEYRWGPRLYPVGDTPLQQALIQETMTDTLAEALGLQPNNPSFLERLSGFFSKPPSRPPGQSYLLPAVDPSLVPKSVDRGKIEAQKKEEAQKDKAQKEKANRGADPMEGVVLNR